MACVANDESIYQEEVQLRTDIKRKMDTRRSYRRGRRHRHCRYRQTRFLNRKNSGKSGRIPPSIKAKKDAIVRTISKLPYNKNVFQIKTFKKWDCVSLSGKIGFISGFTGTSAYIVDIDGNYIRQPTKSYKQVTLSKLKKCHTNQDRIL